MWSVLTSRCASCSLQQHPQRQMELQVAALVIGIVRSHTRQGRKRHCLRVRRKTTSPTLPGSSLWSSLCASGCSKPSAGIAGFFRGGTGSARADADVCAHKSTRLNLLLWLRRPVAGNSWRYAPNMRWWNVSLCKQPEQSQIIHHHTRSRSTHDSALYVRMSVKPTGPFSSHVCAHRAAIAAVVAGRAPVVSRKPGRHVRHRRHPLWAPSTFAHSGVSQLCATECSMFVHKSVDAGTRVCESLTDTTAGEATDSLTGCKIMTTLEVEVLAARRTGSLQSRTPPSRLRSWPRWLCGPGRCSAPRSRRAPRSPPAAGRAPCGRRCGRALRGAASSTNTIRAGIHGVDCMLFGTAQPRCRVDS